jgi:hypothetical protein
MAHLDEQALRREHHVELQATSLRYGLITASVTMFVLGCIFINDYFVMDAGLLSLTRMVGIVSSVIYIVLWLTFLRQHQHYAIAS